jgi:transposase-like protein
MAQLAADLGISESCLRHWVARRRRRLRPQGRTATDEQGGLVELRRNLRVAEMEVEILQRAAAYFAQENLPRPK